MFKIAPIQSTEEQIEVAKACGTEYKAGAFGYSMRDAETGDLMGFSQFEISANGGILLDLRPVLSLDDYEAMFILARQTMNFLEGCGAFECYANSEIDNTLLRKVGFREVDGKFYCNTKGMFDGHCGCKHG